LIEKEFAKTIKAAGGNLYIAGGWVRDVIRGAPPRDKDYVVAGLREEIFCRLFPGAFCVGRGFPVYKLEADGRQCDVAFARSEVKTGQGYRGFSVSFDPGTTIEKDLYRRDTTINSMATDVLTGELIDPFGGASDIADKIIRATSEHFADDPVRALRAARQAAQFGYSIEPGTIGLMRSLHSELAGTPRERAVTELGFALSCERPSVFFRYLLDAGILGVTYPWIAGVANHGLERGIPGDAFGRLMDMLDRAALVTDRPEIRFAAIVCGLAREGLEKEALRRPGAAAGLPGKWIDCASFAVSELDRVRNISAPGGIADFLQRLRRHPIGADGMTAIIRAGALAVPEFLAECEKYYEAMDSVTGDSIPESLCGPARGEWLRRMKEEAVFRL
jgi:tRNA nucleotidyltransferase (CCA-adding enzyme)